MAVNGVLLPTESFPHPTLDLDMALLELLHSRVVQPGNQYKLGGKVNRLNADSSVVRAMGIDCSGYVRWILHRSTHDELVMPDGSVQQADWLDDMGFKRSSIEACKLKDGVLRIVQYRPTSGIGHIALVLNGETIESHGGTGPDSRPWTGIGWQGACRVWCLTAPTG